MRTRVITALLIVSLASPGLSQIGLPPVGQTIGGVIGTVDQTLDQATDRDLTAPVKSVRALARDRLSRLSAFVRANRAEVEVDDLGQPARRGVVLLLDPDSGSLATARALGFTARPVAGLEALGFAAAELIVPEGVSLADALTRLRAVLPDKTFTSDAIHFPAGAVSRQSARSTRGEALPIRTAVGVIDGGVGGGLTVERQSGFAAGAPSPSDHGTAVASLLREAGVTHILSADVYGHDPAGGSALAIARALDWLTAQKAPVISISLVGPRNPLLDRAIAATSARGAIIVAAVGNDGPAAPPAFPASYPSVIAVTAVDGRDRALIEAGRALHLDYAAPGADLTALDARGRERSVRGTSFAVPFVAARAAAANDTGHGGTALRPALDAEARDLGKKGPDMIFGRGLLCGQCAHR